MSGCEASLSRCRCGLDEHGPDVAHECVDADPECGGSWFDHPTMPDHVLVVRWPGLRPGGINADKGLATDPEPGEWILEPRPPEMMFVEGIGWWPVKVPRGGYVFPLPPSLIEIEEPS
jgi:hypothetical protein